MKKAWLKVRIHVRQKRKRKMMKKGSVGGGKEIRVVGRKGGRKYQRKELQT